MFLNINMINLNPSSLYPTCNILTSVIYPQDFHRVKDVIIPYVLFGGNILEILLYNRRLVVLTYELIYVVRAAHHYGKINVKQDYCDLPTLTKIARNGINYLKILKQYNVELRMIMKFNSQ